MADDDKIGLGGEPKKDWPTVSVEEGDKPIDMLKPRSAQHEYVLNYLVDRIKFSEDEMSKLYPRWRVSEKKYQAYISLPDWEQELKTLNNAGAPPKAVSITIPYTFATISTIVTYLIHTFAGRKPMFQVASNKAETTENARNMETVLQYNADHNRFIKHLFQYFQDGQQYGVGIMRNTWKKEIGTRTIWVPESQQFASSPSSGGYVPKREKAVTYEGNEVCTIDPYKFLPDPRVPMAEVNRKGEFVFWKSYEGRHTLKKAEAMGKVKWVDAAKAKAQNRYDSNSADSSNRSLASGGDSEPANKISYGKVQDFYEVHQGSVEIIPAELGLGESEVPEKWLFTILNKNQIIQAEPLEMDHDMHPVAVVEPYTMGYSFGHLGMADYLNQIQDSLSWLINSHMDNVRTALNNMFVVDPSRVEIQDIKEPGAGKLIRLKKSAYGQDVRQAVNQLQVYDVTTNHVRDFQLFMSIGDALSSITDNLRGLQDSGGRKTATEVRTAGEASASRLAAQSRLHSAQGFTDLTEQMSMNLQQKLSNEFLFEVVGQYGVTHPLQIGARHLTGDFHYPIHDGTLPLDRVAMLDVWKEIMFGVSKDQELRGSYSLPKLFEFVAQLGGAKNIEQFRIQPQGQEQIQGGVQAGNLITPQQALETIGGGAGAFGDPSNRLIGGF